MGLFRREPRTLKETMKRHRWPQYGHEWSVSVGGGVLYGSTGSDYFVSWRRDGDDYLYLNFRPVAYRNVGQFYISHDPSHKIKGRDVWAGEVGSAKLENLLMLLWRVGCEKAWEMDRAQKDKWAERDSTTRATASPRPL